MLIFVCLVLYTLALIASPTGELRQYRMERLCRTVNSPTGNVLSMSQWRTNFDCAVSCFETFSCSCFSFQKDPGNTLGSCYLYTGTVTCGTESSLSSAWSTYNFGNETSSSECDSGWYKYNNSCYFLVTIEQSVVDSKQHCVSIGGVLASVADDDENQFIMDLPVNQGYGNRILWLGGHDSNTEGVWEWLSGEPWLYTNFMTGEPQGGTNENELALWSNGKWVDLYPFDTEFAVCEKPL